MGSTAIGGSESSFVEYFDLKTLLSYLHFIQVINSFILFDIYQLSNRYFMNRLINAISRENNHHISPVMNTDRVVSLAV